MGNYIESKKAAWRAQRTASRGAAITLLAGSGHYTASFDCANRVAEVLGTRELQDLGDGLLVVVPFYEIAFEDMHSALEKLTRGHSVALVDYVCDSERSRFVLIWTIPAAQLAKPAEPKEISIDEI